MFVLFTLFTAYGLHSQTTSEVLIIRENGNIGINQATPTEALDIVGNVKVTGTLNADTIADVPKFYDYAIDTTAGDVDGSLSLPNPPTDGDKLVFYNSGSSGNHIINLPGNISLGDGCEITFTWRASSNKWSYDRGTIIDRVDLNPTDCYEKYAGGKILWNGFLLIGAKSFGTKYYNTTFFKINSIQIEGLSHNPQFISSVGIAARNNERVIVYNHSQRRPLIAGLFEAQTVYIHVEGYWKDPNS